MFETIAKLGGVAILASIVWFLISIVNMARQSTKGSSATQTKMAIALFTIGIAASVTGSIFTYRDYGLTSNEGLSAAIEERKGSEERTRLIDERAKAQAEATNAKSEAKRKCEATTAAFVMSQTYVSRSLKSPSSAVFPLIDDHQVEVKVGRGCSFRVNAWVDSDNSFGAKIRTRYSLKMALDPETDKWTGTDLILE